MPLEQPLPQAENKQATSGQLRPPHGFASVGLSKQQYVWAWTYCWLHGLQPPSLPRGPQGLLHSDLSSPAHPPSAALQASVRWVPVARNWPGYVQPASAHHSVRY